MSAGCLEILSRVDLNVRVEQNKVKVWTEVGGCTWPSWLTVTPGSHDWWQKLKMDFEIVLMCTGEFNIPVSLSPEPSSIVNYTRPLSQTVTTKLPVCIRGAGGTISPVIAKLSLPRSGPLFNYTFDSSPPFFLLYHLSTPRSQPTHTVAMNFTPGLTPISRTTAALTLIHFQSCKVVDWIEIDDSIFGMKLKSPFGIDSFLLLASPPLLRCLLFCPPASHYLGPGLLSTANFIACMETWVRWQPQSLKKCPAAPTRFSQNTFSPHRLITKTFPSNMQTLKTKRFILSIAPSRTLVAI